MKLDKIMFILITLEITQANGESYGNKTFKEWTWITAHNANVNPEDSSVIAEASNQKYGISKLLKYGVRGFMLDISYRKCSLLEKAFKTCHCEGICLCHGQCDASIKDGFNIKPFSYALKKLVAFLKQNKNEIITIFLENHVNNPKDLKKIYDSVPNLNDLLFDPNDAKWNVRVNGWPRIVDMIQANKRFLIVDDEKKASRPNPMPGVIRIREYFIENHYKYFHDHYQWHMKTANGSTVNVNVVMPRCVSVRSFNNIPIWHADNPLDLTAAPTSDSIANGHRLFLFNHFYGVAISKLLFDELTLELINTKEFIRKRVQEKCDPATHSMRPNFIGLDFIDKHDAKKLSSVFNA
jgi:hypothetical protein